MRPIFLIGFMGAGKSTLGRALGRATGMTFIDLDSYIETRYHSNIRDIFATRGEQAFRDMERRMLEEVSDFEDVIIACGGGTPCFGDNMALMNSRGLTVLLEASIERLLQRLKAGRSRRPLIANLDDDALARFIASSIDKRMPHYGQAARRFDADRLDNREQIDTSVNDFITRFNLPTK